MRNVDRNLKAINSPVPLTLDLSSVVVPRPFLLPKGPRDEVREAETKINVVCLKKRFPF